MLLSTERNMGVDTRKSKKGGASTPSSSNTQSRNETRVATSTPSTVQQPGESVNSGKLSVTPKTPSVANLPPSTPSTSDLVPKPDTDPKSSSSTDVNKDCEICSEEIQDLNQKIVCTFCKTCYHAGCVDIPEEACKMFNENGLNTWFTWLCSSCTCGDNQKEKQSENETSKLNNLEKIKTEIIHDIKEVFPEMMQSEMKKYYEGLKATESSSTNSDNDVKHALLLQPKDTEQPTFSKETWSDIVNKCSVKLNDVPVRKAVLTSEGKGYMLFPNKESRNTAAKNLESECKITLQDKNTKSVYPTIKIHGIPKESFDKDNLDTLREELMKKNGFIKTLVDDMKKTFEIIFIAKKDSNFSYAVVRVDPEIKNAIFNKGNRLYLGLSTCKVTKQYHLIQCYSCQKFGHKRGSEKCMVKSSDDCICLYCAEKHPSKDCLSKKNLEKHKCSNCLASDKNNNNSKNVSHTSNSLSCPILQSELRHLLNRTMGCTINEEVSKNEITT